MVIKRTEDEERNKNNLKIINTMERRTHTSLP